MKDRSEVVLAPAMLTHPHQLEKLVDVEVGTAVEQTVTEVGVPVPVATQGILTIQQDGSVAWQVPVPLFAVDSRPRLTSATQQVWTVPTSGIYYLENVAYERFTVWWPFPKCFSLEAGDTFTIKPNVAGRMTILLVAPL